MERLTISQANILDLLKGSSGTLYIPQEVISRTDICDNTKYIFGIVFNECVKHLTKEAHINQAADIVKEYLKEIEIDEIKKHSLDDCTDEQAADTKKEHAKIASETDMNKYVGDCLIYLADSKDGTYSEMIAHLNSLSALERSRAVLKILEMLYKHYPI